MFLVLPLLLYTLYFDFLSSRAPAESCKLHLQQASPHCSDTGPASIPDQLAPAATSNVCQLSSQSEEHQAS